MIPFILDYTIEKVNRERLFNEQKALRELTGKSFKQGEAEKVWSKVQDHKWYVSERLGRDVGFRVAAIDFVENFYQESVPFNGNRNGKMRRASHSAVSLA